MRTPIWSMTPTQWLASVGMSTAKIAEVLSSFRSGASIQVYSYRAPHLFLRFHGASSGTPIHLPNYWADGSALGQAFDRASQFEGFLSDAEISLISKNYYRELTAICHNWNPLDSDTLWKIQLRGAETIEGLEGPVGPQPTHAATRKEAASISTLAGGAMQVFLYPLTPFVCTPVKW